MRGLWSELGGTRTPPDGKTKNSVRAVALDPITLDALRPYVKQREVHLRGGSIVPVGDVRLPEECIGRLR
jgi:hypothetical protein